MDSLEQVICIANMYQKETINYIPCRKSPSPDLVCRCAHYANFSSHYAMLISAPSIHSQLPPAYNYLSGHTARKVEMILGKPL